jgi:uncharacterized protein (TIGR00255 family)
VQKENESSCERLALASMTGLGRASLQIADITIDVVAKSVNHRGLDIKYRLPADCACLELAMNAFISNMLSRGRVDIEVSVSRAQSTAVAGFDEHRLTNIIANMSRLQELFPKISWQVGLSDLMALGPSDDFAKPDGFHATIMDAFKQAVKDLASSREREGRLLSTKLMDMLTASQDFLSFIGDGANADVAGRFLCLTSRVKDLFSGLAINEDRLYQELALLVERADFKEEIDRLHAHIEHFLALLHEGGAKGRKLDFLCQEMLRECTTLLCKAQDHGVMKKAIDLKAEIERIREQVQNIE